MWYFSWVLGLGLALAFGVLNAIWYEMLESGRRDERLEADSSAGPP